MDIDFKRYIINEISRLPFYHVSPNGISHTIKCPYCDDNSPKHGHFGLKIDVESDEPILYHCFRCSAGGVLNQKVLNDLNLSIPNDLLDQMSKTNKVYAKRNIVANTMIMPFEIPTINNSLSLKVLAKKIDYINERIGLKLTYSEGASYRIIFSFKDFIDHNNISDLVNIDTRYLRYIDENYVGFLSLNKNNIIFRSVTGKGYMRPNARSDYMRYIKYVLDRNCEDPNNYFTVPTVYDIMLGESYNVHISEGTFDILSVMHNNVFPTNDNNLFFAVCGFGFTNVIKNIIKLGICPINLYIYADNDKTDSAITRQILSSKSGIRFYIKSLTIIRNSYVNEKDFGVPIDRINVSQKRININQI